MRTRERDHGSECMSMHVRI